MSSANVCGFPCLSRHMNLKVSPLTKWNFAVYPGCVCVCDISVHAFFHENLNMSEVFSFLGPDPCLVHLTNQCQPTVAFWVLVQHRVIQRFLRFYL